ncbi:formylglycine-generating enzyme family protein [Fusobacterium polymorphum]|uniref:formylglycine-generating enzyme family protein n=1 Tax=Fusobacterium nucleatum subsp. polymorphum TaxID=76857 RepID=UPI0030CD13ED
MANRSNYYPRTLRHLAKLLNLLRRDNAQSWEVQEGTFDYKYSGSNNIDEVAWYYENSGAKNEEGTTQNVGLKEANQLGLYDCSGNVWEWCYDMSDDESIEDGIVYRKLKGGAWISNLELCQNFFCTSENAIFEDIDIGFRIVRTIY